MPEVLGCELAARGLCPLVNGKVVGKVIGEVEEAIDVGAERDIEGPGSDMEGVGTVIEGAGTILEGAATGIDRLGFGEILLLFGMGAD